MEKASDGGMELVNPFSCLPSCFCTAWFAAIERRGQGEAASPHKCRKVNCVIDVMREDKGVESQGFGGWWWGELAYLRTIKAEWGLGGPLHSTDDISTITSYGPHLNWGKHR